MKNIFGKMKLFCVLILIMLLNSEGFAQSFNNKNFCNKNFPNDKNYFVGKKCSAKNYSTTVNTNSTVNQDLAKRYLKLGNSYREAGDFGLAFEFLELGQQSFQRQRNFEERYWYAVSLEFLGYCFRDMGNFQKARELFSQSLSIYRRILTMPQGSHYAVSELIQNLEVELTLAKCGSEKPRNSCPKFKSSCPKFKTTNCNNPTNTVRTGGTVRGFEGVQEAQIETDIVNLDNQRLTSFPDNISRKTITNISLAHNRFTSFPDEILRYSTLEVLNISFNRINNFPDLSRLQNLEYLDFSNNRIREVDASIGKLQELEYLNLSNNRQLRNISFDIGKLRNSLKVLDIRNTRIDESTIRQLTRELPNTNILSGNTERNRNQNQNTAIPVFE